MNERQDSSTERRSERERESHATRVTKPGVEGKPAAAAERDEDRVGGHVGLRPGDTRDTRIR